MRNLSARTLAHRRHHCNSIDIDDRQWTKARQDTTTKDAHVHYTNNNTMLLTGGNGTVPVNVVYCLNMSLGVGPRKKKPSNMPDSNIHRVVTSGTSLALLLPLVPKKLLMVEKIF
jgi:hypothetical protein